MEVDNPHTVLYELAKPQHHNEATRIMGLPPAKQGVALAKFAANLSAPRIVSGTPEPPGTRVQGGSGSGLVTTESPNLSMADWIKAREAEVEAKRKAGVRGLR